MSDNIKILKNYIIYFLLLILVCMVGICNVFADTFENIGYLDNDSYVSVKVGYTSQQLNLTRTNQYQLSQVEEMYIEIENYNFQGGTTYAIEFYTPSTPLAYVNAFGAYGETSSGQPVSCETAGIYNDDIHYLNFKFNCSTTVNYLKLNLFNSSNNYIMDTGIFQWNYVYLKRVITSTGTEILESQNAQIIQGQQDIINNQTQNTQDIINNQNANTDKEIESQQVCNFIDFNDVVIFNSYLGIDGNIISSSNFGITDYIYLPYNASLNRVLSYGPSSGSAYCFYDDNKNIISCSSIAGDVGLIDIPNNAYYFRSSIIKSNRPNYEICQNGNQALNDSITDLNDSLNDDDSSGATSEASEFFNSFTTNTFGLTSIITAPLNLIQSLTSSTCTELHLPLPYLNNKYLDLPCMTTIYQNHFGAFFTMYQTITYGIIAYWVIVRIFNQVKDFKNPEHDEIEVVDL